MEISLGKELNQEKYEEVFKNTIINCLTLDEIIDIAINGKGMNIVSGDHKLWEFAGAYYRYTEFKSPVLVIDRSQTVGGYNNDEICLLVANDYMFSLNGTFENLVKNKIAEKTNNVSL